MIISIRVFHPAIIKLLSMRPEYNASAEKSNGVSIKNYRRKQVNKLVKGIKKAIKAIDPSVVFGVSPAGNIDSLNSKYAYYVNIKNGQILQSLWITSLRRSTGASPTRLRRLPK